MNSKMKYQFRNGFNQLTVLVLFYTKVKQFHFIQTTDFLLSLNLNFQYSTYIKSNIGHSIYHMFIGCKTAIYNTKRLISLEIKHMISFYCVSFSHKLNSSKRRASPLPYNKNNDINFHIFHF